MDDLLSEFLTETTESLDVIDVELVKFEQDPNNAGILDNIFRLVHTIKGTCGFLGLPRLEALAHAAETLMGKYRDGSPVTSEGVSLILDTIDRLKEILGDLEQTAAEPAGSDKDLISKLEAISLSYEKAPDEVPASAAAQAEAPVSVTENDAGPRVGEVSADELERAFQEAEGPDEPENDAGPRVGEVSEEELERAFLETDGPEGMDLSPVSATAAAAAAAGTEEANKAETAEAKSSAKDAKPAAPDSEGVSLKNQSIRVNVDTLEHLMTMVSELVLTRNQLLEMVRRLDDSEFKVPLQRLSNVTAELQEGVMQTRMQPIGNAWQKLPRIIRDLSKELDKKIDLQMIGAETELDRQVLEMIKDPLTHMVRNSADHGLEPTADRAGLGKPEVGVVTLKAYHEGGHIIIDVTDDGRGINTEKVSGKMLENGLVTQAELDKMTEQQIHKFVFNAGLSTAEKVTSVSGRGVGMDVVRTNIELIGGTVDVKSVQGEGSVFSIKIPLTLAIVSALIVESSNQRFAIPQLSVVELVRTSDNADHKIEMINNTPVLRLRNKLLPLIKMSQLLHLNVVEGEGGVEIEDGAEIEVNEEDQNLFVVVIQVGSQCFGIVVDSVFDTEEIVVKPMSAMLRDIALFSGNTILGDGSVIMIIDPNGIAQSVSASVSQTTEEEEAEQVIASSTDEKTAMLLFRAGSGEPKAVPLSLITRLEEIDIADIEHSNGHDLVQYRGTLMPLVFINDSTTKKEEGMQPILVFTDERHSMGLVVDEIVDIVEDRLNVEISSKTEGMIGSAVIKGKATEVIDIGHYIESAFGDWTEQKDGIDYSAGMRLLLVDDSAFFRNMLAPLLSSSGYKVTLAESAVHALKLRDTGAVFDVIVSDIEMPEMDGIKFAETLRRDSKWQGTPIIALSSNSTPQVIEKTRQAGFVDFVGKFDRQGLIESLKDCHTQLGAAA